MFSSSEKMDPPASSKKTKTSKNFLDIVFSNNASPNRAHAAPLSPRWPDESAPAKDVDVEMIHRLTAVPLGVDHKAGAVFAAACSLRQLLGPVQQAACKGCVLGFQVQEACDVLFWDDQKMQSLICPL